MPPTLTQARASIWPDRWYRQDAWATLATGIALLLWDFTGGDGWMTRHYGNAQGFVWREHALPAYGVHQGGRLLAGLVLLSLLLSALRAPRKAPNGHPLTPGLTRGARLYWWCISMLCLLLVPALKQISSTSCPWDLAEFGGHARWVSHWQWVQGDGGPGHCFPSGHAVAAFAFLTQYFLWRPTQPLRARRWLLAVLVVGGIFAWGQLARGAHHLSHSAWSAWLCWLLCVTAYRLIPERLRR